MITKSLLNGIAMAIVMFGLAVIAQADVTLTQCFPSEVNKPNPPNLDFTAPLISTVAVTAPATPTPLNEATFAANQPVYTWGVGSPAFIAGSGATVNVDDSISAARQYGSLDYHVTVSIVWTDSNGVNYTSSGSCEVTRNVVAPISASVILGGLTNEDYALLGWGYGHTTVITDQVLDNLGDGYDCGLNEVMSNVSVNETYSASLLNDHAPGNTNAGATVDSPMTGCFNDTFSMATSDIDWVPGQDEDTGEETLWYTGTQTLLCTDPVGGNPCNSTIQIYTIAGWQNHAGRNP